MPKSVSVPLYGDVEFPDSMDDTAIATAAKRLYRRRLDETTLPSHRSSMANPLTLDQVRELGLVEEPQVTMEQETPWQVAAGPTAGEMSMGSTGGIPEPRMEQLREGFMEAGNTPILPIGRAAESLIPPRPRTGVAYKDIPQQTMRGVAVGVPKFLEGFTTPFTIGTVAAAGAAGAASQVLRTLVSMGFSIHLGKDAIEQTPEVIRLAKEGKIDEATQAAVQVLGTGALSAGLARHSAKSGARLMEPKPSTALMAPPPRLYEQGAGLEVLPAHEPLFGPKPLSLPPGPPGQPWQMPPTSRPMLRAAPGADLPGGGRMGEILGEPGGLPPFRPADVVPRRRPPENLFDMPLEERLAPPREPGAPSSDLLRDEPIVRRESPLPSAPPPVPVRRPDAVGRPPSPREREIASEGDRGPLGELLDLPEPKVKTVRTGKTREQLGRQRYDEGTLEDRIIANGGLKLDLTKEEHIRLQTANINAKTNLRSYDSMDPIRNMEGGGMTPDQMFEALGPRGEGVIPPAWTLTDFMEAMTDRTRKRPDGEKYRGRKVASAQDTEALWDEMDAMADRMAPKDMAGGAEKAPEAPESLLFREEPRVRREAMKEIPEVKAAEAELRDNAAKLKAEMEGIAERAKEGQEMYPKRPSPGPIEPEVVSEGVSPAGSGARKEPSTANLVQNRIERRGIPEPKTQLEAERMWKENDEQVYLLHNTDTPVSTIKRLTKLNNDTRNKDLEGLPGREHIVEAEVFPERIRMKMEEKTVREPDLESIRKRGQGKTSGSLLPDIPPLPETKKVPKGLSKEEAAKAIHERSVEHESALKNQREAFQGAHGETGFQVPMRGENRYAIFSPSARADALGKWQASYFDKFGPSGHHISDTWQKGVESLQREFGVDLSQARTESMERLNLIGQNMEFYDPAREAKLARQQKEIDERMAGRKVPTEPKVQREIEGAGKFTEDARLADDKAKLEQLLTAKPDISTPQGRKQMVEFGKKEKALRKAIAKRERELQGAPEERGLFPEEPKVKDEALGVIPESQKGEAKVDPDKPKGPGGQNTLYSNPFMPLAEFYTRNIGEPLADWLSAGIERLTPEFINEAMRTNYKRPLEWVEARREWHYETADAPGEYIKLGRKTVKGFTQAEQQKLGEMLEGKVSEKDLRAMKDNPEWAEAIDAVKVARAEFDNLGSQSAIQGLLETETFFLNHGKYLPRLYRKYELNYEQLLQKYGAQKPMRLDRDRYKKRGDIPEEVRFLSVEEGGLGQIREPGYIIAKGLSQIKHDVETAKLFNFVAKREEWTFEPETLFDLGKNPADFTKMPVTDKLGKLSGKYVEKHIAEDINAIVRMRTELNKISDALVSEWKFFKVVTSPAAWGRNTMSNTLLNWLGGLTPLRLDLYAKSLNDLVRQKGMYEQAKEDRVFSATFSRGELDSLMDSWHGTSGGLMDRLAGMKGELAKGEYAEAFKKVRPSSTEAGQKLSRFYQAQESWFKLAKYMHNLERGMNRKAAARDAIDTTFDYTEVPKFVDWARRSPLGSPFLTFTYKAIPRILRSAVTHPWRLATIAYGLYTIQDEARKRLGISESEYDKIQRILPDRMRPDTGPLPFLGPKFLLLPFKDKYGQLQFLDLTYILPWGDIGETGASGIPQNLPIYASPARALFEVFGNYSFYTGRPIYDKNDSTEEAAKKLSLHMWRFAAPTLAPGGYGETRLRKAITGEQDYFGRVSSVGTAMASVLLGLKTTPIDPNMERFYRVSEYRKDMEDLEKEVMAISGHQGLEPEVKQEEIRKLGDKARARSEKAREMFK